MKRLRKDWLPLLALVAMVVASAYAWNRVPNLVPVHWNVAGEVDRYGSRFEALGILPLVTLLLYGVSIVVKAVSPESSNSRLSSAVLKIVAAALAPLHLGLVAATLGLDVAPTRLAGFVVGIILLFTGNLLPKAKPSLWLGLRTPWTLSSRLSWQKSNRAAGWILTLAGLAFLVTALVTASPVALFIVVGLTVLAALGLTGYSYLLWRRDPHKGSLV